MLKSPRSAYIHIPFCHRRCFYCDFAVIPMGDKVANVNGNGSKTINDYLTYLEREILSIEHKSSLSTIYIGGGTPSILNPSQIKNIIKIFEVNYGVDLGAEISMEIDPASFDENDLYGFINAGVNRFSLGAQSFNDKALASAGRRHTSKDIEQACIWLKKAKKDNCIKSWSLDLIQNLPDSNYQKWQKDLENALRLKPPHISIYDLNVEEGTVFKRMQDLGKLTLPSHEEAYENAQITHKLLKTSGYTRYEISNYSLPGHQSRHNRVYWRGFGWWGFGQGATSSPWGMRFTRPRTIKKYKEWVDSQFNEKKEESLSIKSSTFLDLDERIMLGMRLKEGLNIKKLFSEQGWDKEKSDFYLGKLLKSWENYRKNDILCKEGDRFFLSQPKGMELSNQVLVTMFSWWDDVN